MNISYSKEEVDWVQGGPKLNYKIKDRFHNTRSPLLGPNHKAQRSPNCGHPTGFILQHTHTHTHTHAHHMDYHVIGDMTGLLGPPRQSLTKAPFGHLLQSHIISYRKLHSTWKRRTYTANIPEPRASGSLSRLMLDTTTKPLTTSRHYSRH